MDSEKFNALLSSIGNLIAKRFRFRMQSGEIDGERENVKFSFISRLPGLVLVARFRFQFDRLVYDKTFAVQPSCASADLHLARDTKNPLGNLCRVTPASITLHSSNLPSMVIGETIGERIYAKVIIESLYFSFSS